MRSLQSLASGAGHVPLLTQIDTVDDAVYIEALYFEQETEPAEQSTKLVDMD